MANKIVRYEVRDRGVSDAAVERALRDARAIPFDVESGAVGGTAVYDTDGDPADADDDAGVAIAVEIEVER